MDKKLAELVERLRAAHGEKLIAAVLYGSAAGGDYHGDFSDLNVLTVLSQISPADLQAAEPVFKWWRGDGNPAPLLMTEAEVQTSTDCFPMEFHDMQERRRVLFGKDVIAGLKVDRSFYRAQVEHELRAKLLRLRQKAAGVLGDEPALLKLMVESVSTFCVLARHALLLSGIEAGWQKRDVVGKLRETGLDGSALLRLLDYREKRLDAKEVQASALFAEYLKQVEGMVEYVDRLEK